MCPKGLIPLCVLLLPACTGAAAQRVITYHVVPHCADKTLQVRMDIPHIHELTVRLQIPLWSPGAYFVANFIAANIADLSAEDTHHKKLRVYHSDSNTWEIAANGAQSLSVQYTVKNADLEESDGAPKRGHISGPRTYLYVVGRKAERVELALAKPPTAKVWNVAVSLDPVPEGLDRSRTIPERRYTAPNYDVLADAPIEMGDFIEERFEAGGKPHSVVIYGQYDQIDREKLVAYCKRIAETAITFFGDAPFVRYVFEFQATHAKTAGPGGLEHMGSTEIGPVGSVDDSARATIAHEYFHLWNVKRIRPYVLGPFDYVTPPRTRNLWWAEGITDYYGELLSHRAGLTSEEEYLKHLSNVIMMQQNNPVRLKVSADEASLHVFEDNNPRYGRSSYQLLYTKGELIGLCLDLKIRQVTKGRHNLDDVMRMLYAQVRHGEGPGFGEDDIKKAVNRVSGHDLSDYYDAVARGTEELPLAECLNSFGLNLIRNEPPTVAAALDMTLRPDPELSALIVSDPTPEGAAARAGMKAGDHILAINGQTELTAMSRLLRTTSVGKSVILTLLRNGNKIEVEYTMGSATRYSFTIAVSPTATPEQIRRQREWLTGRGSEVEKGSAPSNQH